MQWLTVIWSMTASACLVLALMHVGVWLKDRRNPAHLLFSTAAIAVACVGACELLMLRARTPHEFGLYMRWTHLPLFVTIVSLVCFVRVYFGTGRLWLAWTVCVVRLLILIVNFAVWPNVNYAAISAVEERSVFGGEQIAIATGVIRPWTRLAQLASVLFLVYVIDAAIQLWRRGSAVERQRALTVGGSLAFFVFAAACHTALVQQQILHTPYLISTAFLAPLLVMAYQLGSDVVRVSQLSNLLELSESHLREVGERVELAAAAAKLGFWEWNSRRNTIWATDQFRRIFGFGDGEEIDFRRLLGCVYPDDRSEVETAIARALRHSGEYDTQARIALPDGRTLWLGARGRVDVNNEGTPVLMRGVVFDLTDRKQAETEAARQRNELAHLSRVTMLGELSGSLAHELNQPLTAILSNAQAAQRFLSREHPDLDEVRESLQDIVDEDKRAGEVIRRLRILFKKGEVQQQALDINEVVMDVLKFLNSDLVNHMVTVRVELQDDLPRVQGDRVQLQQVLINLIVNGYDAMAGEDAPNRSLAVRTEYGNGNGNGDGEGVQICVSDRGCGISPERMESVFEPFVTTKNQGMGLGLAVCRTIVSAHGGRIWVTNNSPDHGASFHIALPATHGGVP